jgi:hypothetical protein
MHLLFDIFVIPSAVIAGVVFIATWNLRDAIVGFRVVFFVWPVCLIFVGNDQAPTGLALLFGAIGFAIVWSRLTRRPPIYYYPPPPPPPTGTPYEQIFEPTPPAPPPPRSMSCMGNTVAPVVCGSRGSRRCKTASSGTERQAEAGRWSTWSHDHRDDDLFCAPGVYLGCGALSAKTTVWRPSDYA